MGESLQRTLVSRDKAFCPGALANLLEAYTGLFVLGLVTFLSPCSIALNSVYLTYAMGIGKSPVKGVAIGLVLP